MAGTAILPVYFVLNIEDSVSSEIAISFSFYEMKSISVKQRDPRILMAVVFGYGLWGWVDGGHMGG